MMIPKPVTSNNNVMKMKPKAACFLLAINVKDYKVMAIINKLNRIKI